MVHTKAVNKVTLIFLINISFSLSKKKELAWKNKCSEAPHHRDKKILSCSRKTLGKYSLIVKFNCSRRLSVARAVFHYRSCRSSIN